MEQIVFQEDPLAKLETASTYQEQLTIIHDVLKKRCSGIDRISIALYDLQTHSLKTFIASPLEQSPLKHYESMLTADSELRRIARDATPRIVNDLSVYENHDTAHSHALVGHGYASSYTQPIYFNRELAGFVFFNSLHNRYFRDRVLEQVEVFAHLISELIMHDLTATHALMAAMRTSVALVQKHDMETGAHLERISRYARLIARTMAQNGTADLNDEQIEQIALFSPLHDVGKIGIPVEILQKPDKLNADERKIMISHTMLGRGIVDDLIVNFEFDHVPYINYLRHIVELHHESIDGSGYPHGSLGDEIPLEAKIITVSDVFDALTTKRPYKKSWSIEHAFAMLQLLSIDKLDKDCVAAMIANRDEIQMVQQRFGEAA